MSNPNAFIYNPPPPPPLPPPPPVPTWQPQNPAPNYNHSNNRGRGLARGRGGPGGGNRGGQHHRGGFKGNRGGFGHGQYGQPQAPQFPPNAHLNPQFFPQYAQTVPATHGRQQNQYVPPPPPPHSYHYPAPGFAQASPQASYPSQTYPPYTPHTRSHHTSSYQPSTPTPLPQQRPQHVQPPHANEHSYVNPYKSYAQDHGAAKPPKTQPNGLPPKPTFIPPPIWPGQISSYGNPVAPKFSSPVDYTPKNRPFKRKKLDDDDDIDEEATYRATQRSTKTETPEELGAWIAARKARWPTDRRIAEKEEEKRKKEEEKKKAAEERRKKHQEEMEKKKKEMEEKRLVTGEGQGKKESRNQKKKRKKLERIEREKKAKEEAGAVAVGGDGQRTEKLKQEQKGGYPSEKKPLEDSIALGKRKREEDDDHGVETEQDELESLTELPSSIFLTGDQPEPNFNSSDIQDYQYPEAASPAIEEDDAEMSMSESETELDPDSEHDSSIEVEEASSKVAPPELPDGNADAKEPTRKNPKKLCMLFIRGKRCIYGRNCHYSHELPPGAKPPPLQPPVHRKDEKRKTLYEKLVENDREKENEVVLEAIKFLVEKDVIKKPEDWDSNRIGFKGRGGRGGWRRADMSTGNPNSRSGGYRPRRGGARARGGRSGKPVGAGREGTNAEQGAGGGGGGAQWTTTAIMASTSGTA